MSSEESTNPHVVALNYRVARNDHVSYNPMQRGVRQREEFDVVMDHGEVRFKLHVHYSDEESARAAVRGYLEEWEFQADLAIGSGKFRLEFLRADIVDRDPVLGDRHLPSWATIGSILIPPIHPPVDYPSPPAEVTVDFEDELFSAMRQRYEVYSRYPEILTVVAYFCLTCLEKTFSAGNLRKQAADLYGIPYRDLDRVGSLTGNKGGQQGARKADALGRELTEEETQFLVDMLRLMIRKRGELATRIAGEGSLGFGLG